MDKLNKLLRRLEPWQILGLAAVAWVMGIAVVAFGLAPLAFVLLLPFGEALASIVSLIISIGGGVAVGWYLPRPFFRAYFDAKIDRAMERLYVVFQESKRNGG